MRALVVSVSLSAALLSSCGVKTQLPMETRQIDLPGAPEEVICRMKEVAKRFRLSFHYGHNEANNSIAFRLIDHSFEIEAVNFGGHPEYDFRLYTDTSDDAARSSFKRTFANLSDSVERTGALGCRDVR